MSYRREDTDFPAAWLFDRLVGHFGEGQVFKDVDVIQPGDDFAEVIRSAVASCDVLLVLIGDRWLTITDDNGQRRLDDPGDFVRLEIQAALNRNIRVIPILVGKARMPLPAELPECLAKLTGRQALDLSPAHFDADIDKLLKALGEALRDVDPAPLPSDLRGWLELPRDGDEVGGRIEIRGQVDGWRHGYKLWIALRREPQGAFWLKLPKIRPDDHGNFSVVVFEGGPNGNVVISLLAVPPSRSLDFENWLRRGELTGHYPGIYPTKADSELASVTVSYAPGA
jgi:hypothetical protein